MTPPYVRHDFFLCATWLLPIFDMTPSYLQRDSFIYMTWFFPTGWLQSVGSIKLQICFAEYRLFYRALLQKRLIIFSILLTEATPYVNMTPSYMPDDPFLHSTWLLPVRDMTLSFVRHVSSCTWHDYFRRATRILPYVWHDSRGWKKKNRALLLSDLWRWVIFFVLF